MRTASGVRFHTLTVCPAFTRWGTITDPILPTPIKPTFIEVFLLTALVTTIRVIAWRPQPAAPAPACSRPWENNRRRMASAPFRYFGDCLNIAELEFLNSGRAFVETAAAAVRAGLSR